MQPPKFANLHLHSTHSDAGFRPAYLVRLAKCLGYGALAVTDHETITGIPELFAEAKNLGVEAMTGVEICGQVTEEEDSYHIVGLDFDPDSKVMKDFTEEMTKIRNEHTRRQFELACARGIFKGITWEDVIAHNQGTFWLGNDQVYKALDEMGIIPFTDKLLTFREAFRTGEAGKIKLYAPPAAEVISIIREAGGIAVLAHPQEAQFRHLKELIDVGLQGIEVSHPLVTERAAKLAIHAAVEYNLYCSGGTDHTGPMSAVGGVRAVPADEGATKDEYDAIKERRFG